MSRKEQIRAAGTFLGLAVGHEVCWGFSWHEVAAYAGRADAVLREKKLNPQEVEFLREAAVKRAEEYIVEIFENPRKFPKVRSLQEALAQVRATVDEMLREYGLYA